MIDDETRYWIAKEVADRKEGHDASRLFRQGREIAQTRPKVLITDGLRSHHEAYMKEFWTQKRETRTIHERHIHIQGNRFCIICGTKIDP